MTDKFRKLDDYQHARLRTEMYMGSREEHTQSVLHFDGKVLGLREFTWVPAIYTTFRELIDNSLDEIIGHGFGDFLKVSYDPESMIITVEDNGRGLPIAEKKELGKGPAASILLGEARAGRNFDERGHVAGTNGLGAAIANFTSEWFELQVWQENKRLRQKWEEGTYRKKDIHRTNGPSVSRGARGKHGTLITYKPSAKVFPKMTLPIDFILGRMWEIAVVNPKLKVYFNGTRLIPKNGVDSIKSTYFGNRNCAMMEVNCGDEFQSKFYLAPSFSEDPELTHSVVNNIPAFQGGAHINAFRNLFYPLVTANLEKQLKKEKLTLRRDDISTGLLVFNVTQMNSPNFDSQTKERLITEVGPHIKSGFDEWAVGSMLRRNPSWVEEILDRCRLRNQAKDQREVKKTQKKMKKSPSLEDAIGTRRDKCILFIGEGDSAIKNMSSVRNPDIHGGIPLRGKVMNVLEITPKKALESKPLVDMMTALGLEIGTKAVRKDLRYGKVFITTDEDEDGKNILALLVNFFYRFWPELFEDKKNPFLFKFSTPFIIADKGNKRKYFYAHDYDDFQNNIEKFKGWSITRAKGVGTLTPEDWKLALEKPTVIPIIKDENLAEVLDLIFNSKRADDRKEWLSNDNA